MRAITESLLLERQFELDALERALARARAGSGAMVAIEGPGGIGKSELLGTAVTSAVDAGMEPLRARCTEHEQGFGFGACLQLFGPLVARLDTERVLRSTAGLARPLFSDHGFPAGATAPDRIFPLLHGLHALAANVADERPLLLGVDDAHWSDELSLRFFHYLAQRLDDLPVCIILTVRSGEASACPELLGGLSREPAEALAPEPLSAGAVADIVRAQLGDGADPDFCDACARATAGNPFYLRELLAAVRAEGFEPSTASVERVARLGPNSIARLVGGRLRALGPQAAALARAVAVLGDADLPVAAELAELGNDAAAQAAAELVAADVLAPGQPLSFRHPIVLQATSTAVAGTSLAPVHVRAAHALHSRGARTERVARHLVRGVDAGPVGQPWALEALRAAAGRAASHGALAEAAGYLRRALLEDPERQERGELLAELGLVEAEAGESAGIDRLGQAVELLADPQQRAAALFQLAVIHTHMGRYPDAVRAAERGERELPAGESGLGRDLEAIAVIAATYVILMDPSARHQRLDAMLERPDLEATPGGRAVLGNASIARALDGAPAAAIRELGARALHVERPSAHLFDGMAFPLAAYGLALADEVEAAERACTVAIEAARERGSILDLGAATHVRGLARWYGGAVVDALADARDAVDAGRYGWGATLPMAHALLAATSIERGDPDTAEAALVLPGGEQRWSVNPSYGVFLVARGQLKVAQGSAREGLEQILTAGLLANAVGITSPAVLPWRSEAALVHLQLGEQEEARRLAAAELDLARANGARRATGAALRVSGLATGGEAGTDLLREAVDTLAGSPARLEHARALADLGAAVRRAGKPARARGLLQEALGRADRCGAEKLVAQVLVELRAAGARPRRRALLGPGALTPGERRVAEMATEGLSNREIAQALFVTRRTVEMHLSNAYAKLGIGSREELGGALRSDRG